MGHTLGQAGNVCAVGWLCKNVPSSGQAPEAGLKALPSQANTPSKRPGAREVTYLQDVMKAFETYTVPLRSAPKLTKKTKLVGALVHGNKSKL